MGRISIYEEIPKIDYAFGIITKELISKLEQYKVDFDSKEFSKILNKILDDYSTEVSTEMDGGGITDKLFLDTINKILEPYRLLFNVLKTSKKKNFLKKDDAAFKQYLSIIDMIIEGKSITESCKILAENNYNEETEKFLLGDWENIKRRFNKFRKVHYLQVFMYFEEETARRNKSRQAYRNIFETLIVRKKQ